MMKPEGWDTVSNWLNAWLAADASERERLRARLAHERPDLVREVVHHRSTGIGDRHRIACGEDVRVARDGDLAPHRLSPGIAAVRIESEENDRVRELSTAGVCPDSMTGSQHRRACGGIRQHRPFSQERVQGWEPRA